jgi:hypothetical protein
MHSSPPTAGRLRAAAVRAASAGGAGHAGRAGRSGRAGRAGRSGRGGRAGRATGAVLLAALVAAVVAACSTASSSPPSSSASSPAAAPSSTATAAASPSIAPSTTPSAAAGPAPCATRDLGVKAGLSQGTAGSTYQVIDFTNISNVSCTLYGYPGVSFASTGSSGGQIGLSAKENPTPPRELVTLAPGATANALLRIVAAGNFPPATCGMVTAHWLVIFPPNQTTPVYLSYTSATCSKPVQILTVNVVQPGSGGST